MATDFLRQEPLYFSNREELRNWFAIHGENTREAWIAMPKKRKGLKALELTEVLDEALCFGWIDGRVRAYNDQFYLLRLTPRKRNSIWSRSNRNRAEALLASGMMTDVGLRKIEEARQNGCWDKAYDTRHVPDMNDEFKAALMKVPAALACFNEMAPSYRLQYIYWVNAAKRDETRTKRIEKVISRCLSGQKPGIDM